MRGKCLKGVAVVLAMLLIEGLAENKRLWAADTIRLGFVADITEYGAAFYKSQKSGIDLFIEGTNAAGGILGKKLEVVVRDAQLKPDVGANVARELIRREKCDFLIGPTNNAVALEVTKVAKESKKIVCFHTSNSESLTTTDFQPYMFQVVSNSGMEARGCARYLSERPYKKYGHIGYDSGYGHRQWNAFKKELAARKPDVEFQDVVWVKRSETNYSPYIPSMVAKKPEMIFCSFRGGGGLSTFVKQAAHYGLFKQSGLMALFDLDMLRSTGGDMPEGLSGYARCPFYAINTPEMKAFVKKYSDKFNEWPADAAITVYDGLIVLTEAIKKANSVDSDAVVKALEGLHFTCLRGDRYIRSEDHMANVGIYVGTTEKDRRFKDFLILKDVVEVPAEEIWLSVNEVKKLQAGRN
jgi:branched-chain amino acid transport system substrate-binding protein